MAQPHGRGSLPWQPSPGEPYRPGWYVDAVMRDLRFERHLTQLSQEIQRRRVVVLDRRKAVCEGAQTDVRHQGGIG